MHTAPPLLDPQMPVSAALLTLLADQSAAALVGTPNGPVGVATREQLEARLARDIAPDSLKSLVDGGFTHVHPDHPIDVVVERFGHSGGLLPVVSRADVTRVMGVVRSTTSSNASAAKQQCRRRTYRDRVIII
jgi:CBS domain-containing protein